MKTIHSTNRSVFLSRCIIAVAKLLFVYTAIAQPTNAQTLSAAPDGTGTGVTINGNQFEISGGTLSSDGTNLFHSFAQFGLDTNQIANFLSNPQIQNILGRVVGNDPSVINGLIQVSGGNSNLYLINPAGIIFGSGASLNVGGDFFATTATRIGFSQTTDGRTDVRGWFNAFGDHNYAALLGNPSQFAFDLAQAGSIVNAGNLTVGQGQTITLLSGTVINTGTITASGGNIAIATIPGNSTLKISQPGSLLSLVINPPRDANGLIIPFTPLDLPQLLTGAVNTQTALIVNPNNTVQTTAGTPIPTETETVTITGTLSTSGESGGNIDVFGDRIGILDNAQLLASGNLGGGNIRIGGDYQGQGTVPNAHLTVVGNNATIKADALTAGNGGQIIIWADNTTAFYGTATARGATPSPIPSHGGFIEISGKQHLIFNGNTDVSAPQGTDGTILFDPRDIIVVSAASAPDDNQLDLNNPNLGDPAAQILASDGATPTTDFTISDTKLRSLGGNIILQATRDIILATGTNFTGTNAFNANLTVQAEQDFIFNEDLKFNNNFGLTANVGRNITANAFINTNVTGTGSVNLTAGGDINVQLIGTGGSITLNSTEGDINIIDAAISTNIVGSGQVNLTALGNINTRGITSGGNIVVNSSGANVTVNGRINTNASSSSSVQIVAAEAIDLNDPSVGALNVVDAGGAIAINGNSIIARKDLVSQRGNINLNAATTIDIQSVTTSGGNIEITSNSGPITANSLLEANTTINPSDPKATGSVILQTAGDIQVQDINTSGAVTLAGNNVTVDDSIDIEELKTAPVNITAANTLHVETILTGGTVNLTSSNGNITIGNTRGNENEISSSSRANGGPPGRVNLSAINGTVTLNGLIRAGRMQKTGDSQIEITAARFQAINPGNGEILDQVGVSGSTTVSQPTSLFAFPANVSLNGNVNINTTNVGTLLPGQATIVFTTDLQNPTPVNSSSVSRGSGSEVIRIILPRNQTFAVGSAFNPNDPSMSGTVGIIGLSVAGIPPTLVVLLENASFVPPDLPVQPPEPQPPGAQSPTTPVAQVPNLTLTRSGGLIVNVDPNTVERSINRNQILSCTQVHSEERNPDIDLNENENCRFSEEESILDTSKVFSPENAP